MRTRTLLVNTLLTALVLGALASFLWIQRRGSAIPRPPESLTLTALDGTTASWGDLTASDASQSILILRITNCEPCLYDRMNRVAQALSNGKTAMTVVVSNWQTEVVGWAYHYPETPIYRISESDFDRLETPATPLWLDLTKGEVIHHEVITSQAKAADYR